MAGQARWHAVAGFLASELRRSSPISDSRFVENQTASDGAGSVRVTFLGVSTLIITDGDTTLLTDGFFSRPGLLRARFGRLVPDTARIDSALRRASLTSADAVLVAHSHFDHAMDSARVATKLNAKLVGSESTRHIAVADSFSDDCFTVPTIGEPLEFGKFSVTVYPAKHSPGDIAPGSVDSPFETPARYDDYRTGSCYSFHVAHPEGNLLIHPSANYIAGTLDAARARTVYLGVGALGKQTPEFMSSYWDHVVRASGAERIVLIHWDNFFRSLDRELKPIPRPGDNFARTMTFLIRTCEETGVELVIPRLGARTDPFRSHRARPGPRRADA